MSECDLPEVGPWEVPLFPDDSLEEALSNGSALHRGHLRSPTALNLAHSLPCGVLFVCRKRKKFEGKTEICLSSSNRTSALLLYHSLGIKGPAGVLHIPCKALVCFTWQTYHKCNRLKNTSLKLPFPNVYYLLKISMLHLPHSADHDV